MAKPASNGMTITPPREADNTSPPEVYDSPASTPSPPPLHFVVDVATPDPPAVAIVEVPDDPPAEAPTEPEDNDDVLAILSHRLDDTCEARSAWFRVETQDADLAWRHEVSLWNDKEKMVLDYWDSCEGGRNGQLEVPPDGPFFPARILKEGSGKRYGGRYKIQWVGYRETSWEPASALGDYHNHLLECWRAEQMAEDSDWDDD